MKTLVVEDLVVQHKTADLVVAVALLILAVALLSPPARAHLTPHSRRRPHDAPTHACLPVLLAGRLHGTRETHAP